MKRGLFVVLAAVFALALSGIPAAAAEWCSDDPAIHFVDSSGHWQTVYLTTYGDGVQHSHAVKAQAYTYAVQYGDHGRKTQLRLRVFVPDDSRNHFHVRWTITTGPWGSGKLLAQHDGDSGKSSNFDFEVHN